MGKKKITGFVSPYLDVLTHLLAQADILTWDVLSSWGAAVLRKAPIGSDTGWVLTQLRTHCSAMLKQSLSRKATFDERVYTIQPQTILLPNWMVMGPGANDTLHDSYWLGPFPLHPEGNKVDVSCASTTRYCI